MNSFPSLHRRLSWLVGPLALSLVLSACGGGSTPANTAQPVQSAQVAPAATSPAPVVMAQPPQLAPAPVVQNEPPPPLVQAAPVSQLGEVRRVETIMSEGEASGKGAVIGGVLGGVLGNQVGKGNGRKAATVLGAVGGAVAGNHVEKSRSRSVVGYQVFVRLDNGQTRSFRESRRDDYRVGDRVRVADNRLHRA